MFVDYESDVIDDGRKKQDGCLFTCIDVWCGSDRLDHELEIAESKKAGDNELDRIVGHYPCSSLDGVFINKSALLQKEDNKSGTSD